MFETNLLRSCQDFFSGKIDFSFVGRKSLWFQPKIASDGSSFIFYPLEMIMTDTFEAFFAEESQKKAARCDEDH